MIRSLLAVLVLSVSFVIWPPGVAQAGHDLPETERRIVSFGAACFDLDALTALVEASHKSDEQFRDVWGAVITSKLCFRRRSNGAFERVITFMEWGDQDQVVIVELHDRNGTVAYTWFTKDFWDQQGIKPPGRGA